MAEDGPPPFDVTEGRGALVVSIPHTGNFMPRALNDRLAVDASVESDADHHVDRLYDFLVSTGASVIKANWSRWYIDLNRPADDSPLYPGQSTTGLCPLQTFAGKALYPGGDVPSPLEVSDRIAACWRPYHDRLQALIRRARARHGRVTLLDAHSIVSICPRLFEGRLPDINLGTNGGRSCSAELRERIIVLLKAQNRFSWVADDRFKGGYITRHYGRPQDGIDVVQIELAQCAYMDESVPDKWSDARAADLRALLRQVSVILSG
ncbi:N-formylglutamate deformylase [Pacificimonas flava]|uniref:N-formylglutamate deformylase n=1 Tax=Pacificimonas flava TaxID=1234595 RepID=M2TNS6_9SPHN|nr:N-formylglutamate deformylase [Pacificimonas flava]EMD83371.1 N-formylglutamate deformylase [Pacificimonas flava]MBB5279067.1 N-formylglutamate deformylase [Pacificimonas flava]